MDGLWDHYFIKNGRMTVNATVVTSIPTWGYEILSFCRSGNKIKRGVDLSYSKINISNIGRCEGNGVSLRYISSS